MYLMSSMIFFSMLFLLWSMYSLFYNIFTFIKLIIINLLSFSFSIEVMLDWTSLLFLSTVLFISGMIIMFSMYYIPTNQHKLFLILMFMFITSMVILILSNNIFLMLLGWDGLGLSSYILVIYYQDYLSNASGSITLLSNRIGDILILISISMMFMMKNWDFSMNWEIPTIPLILLTLAACSKSAQFPFSAWLPMAMAAPTPISALVHSSTLVTAGVFMLMRIMSHPHNLILLILMLLSTMTALYSSMAANWEQDMKKIIALSTLSQIAMMMFAISMNVLILTFLHLVIHALFKSTMFLCAGTMIHESSYQDMRMISSNYMYNPLTLSTLGITSMALMGIPFMSGFFSKDAIIENMFSSKINNLLSLLMIMSIGMTASYSIRMSIFSNKMTIKSQPKSTNHHSLYNNIPLLLLSPLTIMSGSFLSWILSYEQIFILSFNIKMNILLMLIMGLMLGTFLSFKSKTFQSLGVSSLHMWAIHIMTIIPMTKSSHLMKTYNKNDKYWQETYGPNYMFYFTKTLSKMNEFPKSSLLMVSTMVMMIPIIIYM